MTDQPESELERAAREQGDPLFFKAGALWLLEQAERQAKETPFEAYDVVVGLRELCGKKA